MASLATYRKPEYTVHLGEECLGSMMTELSGDTGNIFVLTDENTRKYCLPVFLEKTGIGMSDIHVIEITSGDQYKTLGSCKYIWESLVYEGADRQSLLINLGGGVVTDIGGYAAACFKRGIRFINVPTTLMAQVDAAIGGKTGVNLEMIKNQIGVFQHPDAVFVDAGFLETLPERELISGFFEVLKYGLISDKELWESIREMKVREITDWYQLILPCVRIKMEVVDKDPRERNVRKILNFGHTVSHAVETLSLNKNRALNHGEAVSVGLVVEAIISSKVLGLDKAIPLEILSAVNTNFLLPQIPESEFSELVRLMMHDKKNIDDKINFTLIDSIGKSKIDQFCGIQVITESLIDYNNFLSPSESQRR